MQFSLVEAKLVMAMLLRRSEIHSAGGREVGTRAAGTLRPDGDLRVRVTTRR